MWISSQYICSKLFFLDIYYLRVYDKSGFSSPKKTNKNKTMSGKTMTPSFLRSSTTDAEDFPSWLEELSAWSKLSCKKLVFSSQNCLQLPLNNVHSPLFVLSSHKINYLSLPREISIHWIFHKLWQKFKFSANCLKMVLNFVYHFIFK